MYSWTKLKLVPADSTGNTGVRELVRMKIISMDWGFLVQGLVLFQDFLVTIEFSMVFEYSGL